MITLNGLFEGKGKDISWHNVDTEFNEFAVDQLKTADVLLFGRITYELMASYWPTAPDEDPVKVYMNKIEKYVFSRTLNSAGWENTTVVSDNLIDIVSELKGRDGKNIFIFGSSDLSSDFINENLIDEFRIMINPIILEEGKSIFNKVKQPVKLKLESSKVFNSGNVLNYYTPVK